MVVALEPLVPCLALALVDVGYGTRQLAPIRSSNHSQFWTRQSRRLWTVLLRQKSPRQVVPSLPFFQPSLSARQRTLPRD